MNEEINNGKSIYQFDCVALKCTGLGYSEEVSYEKIGYQGILADGSFELFEEKECDWSWKNIADIFYEENKAVEIGDIYYQLHITTLIPVDGELEYNGGGAYPCDTFYVEGGKDIPVPSEVNKAIEWLKLKCLRENNK